jgi:hypothetical protein
MPGGVSCGKCSMPCVAMLDCDIEVAIVNGSIVVSICLSRA